MAGTSLLTLIDDIATLLDDVSLMTKIAAKKTAGVLGDDLALNAEQVTGVTADRELPVVWAVAKGSAINKSILVPCALLISAVAPWAIIPLLMIGGAFLCFEGFEKVLHKVLHRKGHGDHGDAPPVPSESALLALKDPEAFEKARVKGAIRTDFILSAEIIVITLGTVADEPFKMQLLVLIAISVFITVGVYGLVAGIVKIDDVGVYLTMREGDGAAAKAKRLLGAGLLRAAPLLMKALGIMGTIAMFLVGGGIVVHGIPALHHAVEHAGEFVAASAGHLAESLAVTGMNGFAGIVVGGIVFAGVSLVAKMRGVPAH